MLFLKLKCFDTEKEPDDFVFAVPVLFHCCFVTKSPSLWHFLKAKYLQSAASCELENWF